MTDPIAVSQRAREAAELLLIDVKASDCEPYMSRAAQAFARFEAETRKDEREKLIPIIATAIREGEPAPCCEGGPQWGHAWGCPKCPD